jgi:serine kinase of HPr protein (carbohydrate metabolism regulator)
VIYKLADFIVEFKNPSSEAEKYMDGYLCNASPEVSFTISEEDIQAITDMLNGQSTHTNSELSAMLSKFCMWTLERNAFFLHSALFDIDGVGVAFAAPSGTGKTTHMRLWQQLLGNKMTVVNGDKPIVRFFDDTKYPVGYGTPWCGKERYGINGKTEIKHFCFIERSETNSCEKVESSQVLDLFFKQVILPRNKPDSISKTLKLADMFLKNVTVWKIKCNMDISAAKVAYDTIFRENTNEA